VNGKTNWKTGPFTEGGQLTRRKLRLGDFCGIAADQIGKPDSPSQRIYRLIRKTFGAGNRAGGVA